MELDAERCYRAVLARDPRFDGRFFTAVRTTGIYCRPICPAPPPKPRNVRFFPCAAAAEEAGFRPCRRCRPETSPGTPAWLGTSATVSRALRLIAEGELDRRDVNGLAERLGIGERHLRRLFVEHLGTAPAAVAQTRRVHFARKLIDESDLPMTEIAFASGFASLRRFNDAVRATFGRAPRELRLERTRVDDGAEGLRLRLPFRPPYDWEAIARFLASRAIPYVEAVDRSGYRRSVAIGEATGILEIRPDLAHRSLILTLPPGLNGELVRVVERARRLFDLEADPLAIGAHLRRDPALAPLVAARPGLRVPGAWDPFELAVRAILGQQVSVAAASTLAGRIAERFGRRLPGGGRDRVTHIFPPPARLARADLTRLGVTRARARAIRGLAAATAEDPTLLDSSRGPEVFAERLCALPGIGPWTVEVIAMRAFHEPDVLPAGDLGLRRVLGRDGALASERSIRERAEPWRPWRSYAVLHLWSAPAPKAGARPETKGRMKIQREENADARSHRPR